MAALHPSATFRSTAAKGRFAARREGGRQQMAVLERSASGDWRASHVVDTDGELRQAISDLEAHISNYGRVVEHAPIPDAKEELVKDQPLAEPASPGSAVE